MTDIPAVPADGNVLALLVTTIADTANPTVDELTALTVVDISCYLTSDGLNPSLSEQTISDERLCSTATYEQPGRSQRSLSVTYIDNTNTGDANDCKETLVPGTDLYLVLRRGIAYSTAVAASQVVSVWPITAGQYDDMPPEANSVLKTRQKLFVTGAVQSDVEVDAS